MILGLAAMAFASLASWSVLDPSFSHANGKPATNWLGYPGAVFADLAMQFMGLTTALALVPPTLWGWSKLLQQPIENLKKRLFYWDCWDTCRGCRTCMPACSTKLAPAYRTWWRKR